MTGRFLSLEGVEGVGKTTNLQFIVDFLQSQQIEVVCTREPGGTDTGERIREVLLDPSLSMSSETELLLMFASRRELVQTRILPALAAGSWVISDRFTDASFAYQGAARALGFEKVRQLESWLLEDFKPDCTMFLDLPVEIGLQRMTQRSEADRIEREGVEFFERVRSGYLDRIATDPDRFAVIDASQSLAAVQESIASVLRQQIEHHASHTVHQSGDRQPLS